jgi:hypothetical protein
MLAFAHMMHLLANKLTRLGAGRFAFARILASTFDGLFFRHNILPCNQASDGNPSPQIQHIL